MTASAARTFLDRAAAALSCVFEAQAPAFGAAAAAMTAAIQQDRLIYLFGTGHSHMLAEEGHYRAGGLACIVPILEPSLMLHNGAVKSTRLEREGGLAPGILARYPIGAGDVLIVFSNSQRCAGRGCALRPCRRGERHCSDIGGLCAAGSHVWGPCWRAGNHYYRQRHRAGACGICGGTWRATSRPALHHHRSRDFERALRRDGIAPRCGGH
jgi:hypothetical protein